MMTLKRLRLGGAALSLYAAAGLAAAGCSGTGISNPVDAGVVADLGAPALDLTRPGPPGPSLSDISPRSVSNAGGATLTLRGQNFQAGATVTIGGAACLSPVVTGGQITCTAPPRPASCGAVTVVITNPDQQRASDSTTLAYRSSRFGFLATNSISSNGNASAVRAIDASGDGKVDLVAAAYASQTLTVHVGNGDGTFKSQPILTQVGSTGSLQPAAAVLDVTGDGKPDVLSAFTVGTGNRFGLFTGVGDGTFSAPASPVDIGSIAPNSIAAGDVDGDGKPDYALALGGFLSTETTVLLYRNSLVPLASATMDSGARGVTLADLNGDGKPDLLTASRGKGGISVRLNGATGFGVLASFAMGTSTNALAVADYNGDGKLDVAACNTDANTVTVRLGDGSGGFGALFGSPVAVGSSPVSIAATDMDGDGAVDLVVSNASSNDFHVLLGRGDGTFTPAGPFALASGPNQITVGDFNGDRQPDVAANSGNTNLLPVRLQQCL